MNPNRSSKAHCKSITKPTHHLVFPLNLKLWKKKYIECVYLPSPDAYFFFSINSLFLSQSISLFFFWMVWWVVFYILNVEQPISKYFKLSNIIDIHLYYMWILHRSTIRLFVMDVLVMYCLVI